MIGDLRPYGELKNSGVDWLGRVPAHWAVLPNRALFDEVRDRDCPDEQMLSVTIRQGVIKQADFLAESTKKDSSRLDRSAYKLVQPGDLAYNKMRAWQGAIGASPFRGIVSPAYVVQRPRQGCASAYFHRLFRIPAFAKEAERWSYGITSDMWSLRPEHFKLIYSCLPPADEQAAIVRYLDHVDQRVRRLVRAKRKLIALLTEQKQAIIHHAVTCGLEPAVPLKDSGVQWLGQVPSHWEVRRLRDAAGLRVSNVDKHVREGESAVRLCNYVDVYKNDRITQELDFMRATATAEEMGRFRLETGDVLITKDSESWDDIGVPALVVESAEDLISGYHLALLRPLSGQLLGEFLFRALQSKALAYQFHVEARGVTRYGLSHSSIKCAWLPLPPLKEQAEIVSYLDEATAAVDAAMVRARSEIALVGEYRIRLVADVVTGKVDVREESARLQNIAQLDAEEGPDGTETAVPPLGSEALPRGVD